ncbi:type II toxin-antitoxin system PemK/MazF family toxin, partial [Escherichia coli]
TSIFSHSVYLFLREFSLQDSRGGSDRRCQSSKAIVEQIMAADKSCLKTHIGSLSKADMLSVEDAIKIHLGLLR